MVPLFFSNDYGPLDLNEGFLKDWKGKRLPGGKVFSYQGSAGTIVVQEMQTKDFLFRYFIFNLRSSVKLQAPLEKGFQSYLAVKGDIACRLNGGDAMQMDEGRFLLFHSRAGEVEAQFEKGKGCELCSIVYHPSFYREWRELFPKLKLIERVRRFFLPGIVIASPIGTLDAIKELFYQKIEPYLQATFTSMKIKQTLFLMLQQDKDPLHGQMATPRQKELAAAARAIVEKNIKLHYTNVQIAAMLNVERSVLTKAFRHVYDMGLHEFLIQLRFEKARELLLEGGSLQKVAAAVGYKHSTTFSSQFRKYFGYSPLDLQKGIIK